MRYLERVSARDAWLALRAGAEKSDELAKDLIAKFAETSQTPRRFNADGIRIEVAFETGDLPTILGGVEPAVDYRPIDFEVKLQRVDPSAESVGDELRS